MVDSERATPARQSGESAVHEDVRRVEVAGAPLGSLLLQVVRAHARLGTSLLQEAGVSPPHELILFYLDEHGPTPQSTLVNYLLRDRSTVTATLQAMERAGLVQRTRCDSDRRTMTVALTEYGRHQVPPARSAWLELEGHTTSTLSAEQQAQLRDTLTRVRDTLAEVLAHRAAPPAE